MFVLSQHKDFFLRRNSQRLYYVSSFMDPGDAAISPKF